MADENFEQMKIQTVALVAGQLLASAWQTDTRTNIPTIVDTAYDIVHSAIKRCREADAKHLSPIGE